MNSYDPFVHTHVIFPNFHDVPLGIDHKVRGRTWVSLACYGPLPEGAVRVGDGLNDGLDEQGQGIYSVPDTGARFLTQAEAETLWEIQMVDAQLLRYAHG